MTTDLQLSDGLAEFFIFYSVNNKVSAQTVALEYVFTYSNVSRSFEYTGNTMYPFSGKGFYFSSASTFNVVDKISNNQVHHSPGAVESNLYYPQVFISNNIVNG